MANVEKFSGNTEVNQVIRHCNREIQHPSNTDIDSTRSHLNYTLSNHGDMSDYAYYKQRLSNVYVYDKGSRSAETVTAAGWIVTLPEGDYSTVDQYRFFEATYTFLSNRYGGPDNQNTITATVHYDEGKTAYIKDENGQITDREFHIGRPHLHYLFTPTTEIDHDRENAKKWHDPRADIFDEKLCAADVLTKKDLKSFHHDLQDYLDNHDLGDFRVMTGKTEKQGYTVEQLKARTDLENRIVELESSLTKSRDEVKALARENADIMTALKEVQEINRELQNHLDELQRTRENDQNNRWSGSRSNQYERRSRWDD